METTPSRRIVVATYNVLADAYVRPEYFPRCNPVVFVAGTRYPKVANRALGFDADVVCLQEVDATLFTLLDDHLRPAGYHGQWARRGEGRPDGCAMFVRTPWAFVSARRLEYDDGTHSRKRTGLVALIAEVSLGGWAVTLVNTHFKWQPLGTPPEEQIGLVQATELLGTLVPLAKPRKVLDKLGPRGKPCVVCGDFNAEIGSALLNAFADAGFSDAHDASVATHNSEGVARKIDFLMHSASLVATPQPTTAIAGDTPLPSETEPSDHLPLVATFHATTDR